MDLKRCIILNALGCLVAALLVTGCGKESAPPTDGRREFTVNGVVQELPADGKSVVIQHEAISNYMQAMTMPFEVRDAALLKGLKPGDGLTFHLIVTAKEGWIDGITVRSNAPASPPPAHGITISHDVTPLEVGDLAPDSRFTNELGQAVDLNQYRGQVIAFTFFFTSCPYPDFCPRMTSNFGEVAAKFSQMTNAPAHWHLFSISFDPAVDTPAHLLSYGKNVNYNASHWSFLTGDPAQISQLANSFGETYASVVSGSISHNLRTVVIDPHGHIRKIYQGNTWTPDELVQEIIKADSL